ncbi:MAG TPA: SDR family oxidoreductase [Thermoplasmata archaeon]|nr:SDR family oxidoreductase [Thermoplasmata archaeon]
MGLGGKVVLVVGVGGGLGAALVALLGADGAKVVAVARHPSILDPLAAHARLRGWNVTTQVADVDVQADVDRLVADVIRQHGTLDAVSINVGHWHGGESLLHRMTDEEWNAAVRGNLDPPFRVARASIPALIQHGGGSLVFVGAAPPVRWAGSAGYTAGKGGLADLVPRLARDYRANGLRINAVLPGSMTNHAVGLDPPDAATPIPLANAPPGSPWAVARAIRYLLSDESAWVTGALLTVDGGLSTGGSEAPGR